MSGPRKPEEESEPEANSADEQFICDDDEGVTSAEQRAREASGDESAGDADEEYEVRSTRRRVARSARGATTTAEAAVLARAADLAQAESKAEACKADYGGCEHPLYNQRIAHADEAAAKARENLAKAKLKALQLRRA
jgi:hypothetical protein